VNVMKRKHGTSRSNMPSFHGKLQQAFGDDAMSKAQAFRWQKMFSEGRIILEDEQRSR